MILLLGGTTETAAIADGLANSGLPVLVSTLTQTPLNRGKHPNVQQRTGTLESAGMKALVKDSNITSVVDATHPYAAQVTETALHVCHELAIPYYRFNRPGRSENDAHIHAEPDHQAAAKKACKLGSVILLTIGSRNLEPYVEECRETGSELYARVLPCDDSLQKCRELGLPESHVIAARGPFSVDENEALIAEHGITVMVTKDSGDAGGVPAKIAAAKNRGCSLVFVERPIAHDSATDYETISSLVSAIVTAETRPFRVGTTSFILKDDILPNVRFLADKVDDIELLLFESDGQSPLPGEDVVEALASLATQHRLSYTVHLPLDAWIGSEDESVRSLSVAKHSAVIRRFLPLQPRGYVLHCRLNDPPGDLDRWREAVARSLDEILDAGIPPQRLCIEILDYPFEWIEPVVRAHGASICMDLGHVIAAGRSVTECIDQYLDRTEIVHLHGVDDKRDHRSLSKLPPDLLATILARLANDTKRDRVLTLEVFDRDTFEESLALIKEYLA
ncbi:MAG: cobamide remodeling phosphodiesterase CbiR [Kiritimatiellia bacterium]|jgi:precorrin-6A/cobalt-precorrin-6A reductase|nr:cobamide remodeling phosphodiesterase CbiR [Kiritimatiellia bacterium]